VKLRTLVTGALSTNCYILAADGALECVVIDAGGDGDRTVRELERLGVSPKYVLSTHGHADHTGGVHAVISRFGGEFGIGAADSGQALDPPAWLTSLLPDFQRPPGPSLLLKGGETLHAGDINIEVIATPGHTPGSICYRVGDAVFTGDTLFRGSIGRYDLPGGDGAQELASIRGRLLVLDDTVRVFPGHGDSTTIGEERRTNPYLQD
jgi:glyoxylase-like metal-dependent hydrolase (beta-lactamase superfamily II)